MQLGATVEVMGITDRQATGTAVHRATGRRFGDLPIRPRGSSEPPCDEKSACIYCLRRAT
jgi:hypothetical protein